ncbi:MAG: 30S ribosomal protein S28e [Candidatus Woesearchaeota archaeon]|nr:MAG: 30S ribosomal protein S28e [Candidatus Woesearchaeota archaeon]
MAEEAPKEEKTETEEEPKQEEKPEGKEDKKSKVKREFKDVAYPAKVLKIVGRVGGKQSCQQVRCKVMSGRDEGKIMRRNVLGPIRIGDILLLKNTEMSASRLKGGRKA